MSYLKQLLSQKAKAPPRRRPFWGWFWSWFG